MVAGLKFRMKALTVGPTVSEEDGRHGMDLLRADAACVRWLDGKPAASVVYVSFGSFARLSAEQTAEIAHGLRDSRHEFLWVVRGSEQGKLPAGFQEEAGGLVVAWCPQLAVLAHPAVGCFVTHCGWNSTLEALSLGVPMVAVPQWTDQPTNAKLVEDVWGVGVRARPATGGGEGAAVPGAEISRCVREVMDGPGARRIRANAVKWKEAAREAVRGGGSSDRNLGEFVEYLHATAQSRAAAAPPARHTASTERTM